jgi:hypothetical protein
VLYGSKPLAAAERIVVLKVYQVIRRDGKWHALLPDSLSAIVSSDNRELIVKWASEIAKKQNGEVHVYDYRGKVQVICTYDAGVESRTEFPPTSEKPSSPPISQFPAA